MQVTQTIKILPVLDSNSHQRQKLKQVNISTNMSQLDYRKLTLFAITVVMSFLVTK